MHRAALKEDIDRLEDLFDAGWSLFTQDQEGRTVLDIIKRSIRKDIHKPFHLYFSLGNAASVDNRGLELLKAAETGDTAAITSLLQTGVDPLLVDGDGRSALWLAILHCKIDVIDKLLVTKVKEQLALRESDRKWGDTPLHQASSAYPKLRRVQVDIVSKLLKYSPDIEDQTKQGKTPLFLATEWNHDEIVSVLLNHEPCAQVFTKRDNGNTPVHQAASMPEEIKVLRRLLKTSDSQKCLEHRNDARETPIWIALDSGNIEAFKMLKDKGASLRTVGKDGNNLLHLIAMKGLYNVLSEYLDDFDRLDLEALNFQNETPVMIANKYKQHNIAGLLRHC